MADIIDLGGRRQPPPQPPQRQPKYRPIGVSMDGWIATAHVEDHFVEDAYGDYWAPMTYIVIRRRRGAKDTICAFHQPIRGEYLASAANDRS